MTSTFLEKYETARVNFMDVAAQRLGGFPSGWQVFQWSLIGTGGHRAYVCRGAVPRLLKSGPRKGERTFRDCKVDEIVVTLLDIKNMEAEYRFATGNCSACFGLGQRCVGWAAGEGLRFAECNVCAATGKAGGAA